MVRNLVLTPFINFAFAHFMFSSRKTSRILPTSAHLPPDHQVPALPGDLFSDSADEPIVWASRREPRMIELTRLNGEHMVVNSDLIRYAGSESRHGHYPGHGR